MADKIKTKTGEEKFVSAFPAIAFILVVAAMAVTYFMMK
jgi:hypothetical protein